MPYEWILDYPEAVQKKQEASSRVLTLTQEKEEFVSLKKSLEKEKPYINNAANANFGSVGTYLPADSQGRYLDEYEAKVTEWLTKAQDMITRYDTIRNELDVRIMNIDAEIARLDVDISAAQSDVTLWNGRIGRGHNEWRD